jgi:hypothetical protein
MTLTHEVPDEGLACAESLPWIKASGRDPAPG